MSGGLLLKGKAADKRTELQTKRQTTYEAASYIPMLTSEKNDLKSLFISMDIEY